jgi:LmbE family N-acetylglucosaminyl deacetylase
MLLMKPPRTTLFLFAHQDDEMGVFGEIEATIARGEQVACAYLTDGTAGRYDPAIRNRESTSALAALGVAAGRLNFIGTDLAIPDGRLVEHLDAAFDAVQSLARQLGTVNRIVMHAWEGGHQDHDAVHLIGVALAQSIDLVEASQQFPLYRRRPGSPLPFVMFQPIAANGVVVLRPVPLPARLRYLKILVGYPSQRKTMLGLGPMIIWHYLTDGAQQLQPVSIARASAAPHGGKLLYEIRSKLSWSEFCNRSELFRRAHEMVCLRPVVF